MRLICNISAIMIAAGYSSFLMARQPRVLVPTKPPRQAATEEEVAEVEALIAQGAQERKEMMLELRKNTIPNTTPGLRARAVDSLQSLSQWRGPWFPSLWRFNAGEVGFLRTTSGVNTGWLIMAKVVQVIDTHTLLLEYDTHPIKWAWLQGFATAGVVDGDRVRIDSLIRITGTKQYRTALGATKTVLVFEPYPISPILPDGKKKEVPVAQEEELEAEPAPRQWTDATGKFSVQATFRGVIGGNVQLQRKDGNRMSIPLERLSDGDQEWIRDFARGARK